MPTPTTQPVDARARYEADASLGPDGLAASLETTSWRASAVDGARLAQGCERAARAYVGRVGRLFFGLLRVRGTPEAGPSLRLLGVELMGFGPLRGDPGAQGPQAGGELYYSVERGLLRGQPGAQALDAGRLYFRWFHDGAEERFQTEMRGFAPALVGARGGRLRRGVYLGTQMAIHRVVMWSYHRWVARERAQLLGDGAGSSAGSSAM